MDDKRAFIYEHHLCFGCLRKGHITKECKWRHTCSMCSRRHPTCLQIEGKINPNETTTTDTGAMGEHTNEETHIVNSHALTRHASATSSIVPVLVSSTGAPEQEILTYALLDTQSDSTYVLPRCRLQYMMSLEAYRVFLVALLAPWRGQVLGKQQCFMESSTGSAICFFF